MDLPVFMQLGRKFSISGVPESVPVLKLDNLKNTPHFLVYIIIDLPVFTQLGRKFSISGVPEKVSQF